MDTPRLYDDLASWWPLLSAPEEYTEEADLYRRILEDACDAPPATVLELGSGGGNNASHLKQSVSMTLVDRSPGMLAVSRALNPECEHVEGDMRSIRLGRAFDAVFVHDAVAYLTSEEDLRAAFETASVHCRPGGAALFVPDHVRETFGTLTSHGGHDAPGRGLRYLQWTWDPDPADSEYLMDFAYLLRHPDGAVTVEDDRHRCGLFARSDWLRWLEDAGFEAEVLVADPDLKEGAELFLGRREADPGSG